MASLNSQKVFPARSAPARNWRRQGRRRVFHFSQICLRALGAFGGRADIVCVLVAMLCLLVSFSPSTIDDLSTKHQTLGMTCGTSDGCQSPTDLLFTLDNAEELETTNSMLFGLKSGEGRVRSHP